MVDICCNIEAKARVIAIDNLLLHHKSPDVLLRCVIFTVAFWGLFWSLSGVFWTVLAFLGPFWTISGVFGPVFGLFGHILVYVGLVWAHIQCTEVRTSVAGHPF